MRAVIEVMVAGESSLVVTFRVRRDGGDGAAGEVWKGVPGDEAIGDHVMGRGRREDGGDEGGDEDG